MLILNDNNLFMKSIYGYNSYGRLYSSGYNSIICITMYVFETIKFESSLCFCSSYLFHDPERTIIEQYSGDKKEIREKIRELCFSLQKELAQAPLRKTGVKRWLQGMVFGLSL